MSSRVRALSVLIAVFLLGLVIGSGSVYLWLEKHPGSGPIPDRMGGRHHRLAEFLQLSPEQEVRLREIMDESRRKFAPAWTESAEKFREIRAEMDAKIFAILNEDQKKRFHTFLKDMELRRPRPGDRRGFPGESSPFPTP